MNSEIKNTIGLLCKLLNLVYKTNLKPEYFRLAKFNKTDENVVPILWNLLAKILEEDNKISMKNKLHHLNYRRKLFSTTEANCESSELLLAIGFLISINLENTVNTILNSAVLYEHYKCFESQDSLYCTIKNHQHFDWTKLSQSDLENYRKWLCGKVDLNNNAILEYKEHISKIQDKFNKLLDIKANGTLTVYEILALKNKSVGEQYILDTEPILNILSVYSEWLKKEKIFWKWMESVLQEEKKTLKAVTNST